MKSPSALCDSLEITTAVGCPNACKVCPQRVFVGRYNQRSDIVLLRFEDFNTCIGKLPNHVRIDFSGFAEPWLNPQCTDMILYAHQLGFRMAVFTTCIPMSVEDVERISHIPFVTFVVHLPDEDSNMGMPSIVRYREVLERIRSSRIGNIQYMAMGPLKRELLDLFGRHVSGFVPSSRAGNLATKKRSRKSGVIRCHVSMKMRRNVLLPNGDVVLCCNDYGMDHILGNLIKGNYHDLYMGEEYKRILSRLNLEQEGEVLCRYCDWSSSRQMSTYILIREYSRDLISPFKQMFRSLPGIRCLRPFRQRGRSAPR